MRSSRRSALQWNAVLVGVPLTTAAVLGELGWPLANVRLLLLAVFAAEVFLLLVPSAFYGAGVGPITGMGAPRVRHMLAGIEEFTKRNSVTAEKSVEVDLRAIGPVVILALIACSFLFVA